jgi:hypothetical protein
LRRIVSEVVCEHNAKRRQLPITPTSLGSQVRKALTAGNFVAKFTPIAGAARALSPDHAILNHSGPEKQLVYDIYDAVLRPMFGNDLVESQEIDWLPQSFHFDSKIDYRPDLFLQHPFFVKLHNHSSVPPRTTGGSHSELLDTVFGVLEGKMSSVLTSNEHLGKIVSYLDCTNGSIGEYCRGRALKPSSNRGLLFDKAHAVLLDALDGRVTRVITCKWTDEGSYDLIRDHFLSHSRPSWHTIMVALDATLRPAIGIRPFGFLGAGGYGRVFELEMPAGQVIKVVVGEQEQLMICQKEFKYLSSVAQSFVIPVVPDSFATYVVDDFRLAYFRMEAGTPFKITDRTLENLTAAVSVLEEMHRANHIHGDARLDNLVFHGNPQRLVWIDQMVASDQTDNPTLRKLDAVTLMKSILPASKHNLIDAAVDQYLPALDTSHLLGLLQ